MIALNPEEKDGMHDKNTVHASRFMHLVLFVIQNKLAYSWSMVG